MNAALSDEILAILDGANDMTIATIRSGGYSTWSPRLRHRGRQIAELCSRFMICSACQTGGPDWAAR